MPSNPSCKNGKRSLFHLCPLDPNVVAVRPLGSQVTAWRETGKLLKLVSHVSLVKIAAGQGDIGPVDRPPGRGSPDDLQESMQPAIDFRCYPDLFVEDLAEPPAAETRCAGEFDYASHGRHARQLPQRPGNGRVERATGFSCAPHGAE